MKTLFSASGCSVRFPFGHTVGHTSLIIHCKSKQNKEIRSINNEKEDSAAAASREESLLLVRPGCAGTKSTVIRGWTLVWLVVGLNLVAGGLMVVCCFGICCVIWA